MSELENQVGQIAETEFDCFGCQTKGAELAKLRDENARLKAQVGAMCNAQLNIADTLRSRGFPGGLSSPLDMRVIAMAHELDSLRANAIQIFNPPFTPANLPNGIKVVMEAYEPGQWKIGIIEHFGQRWVGFLSDGRIEQIAVDEITRIICLPDFGKDGG